MNIKEVIETNQVTELNTKEVSSKKSKSLKDLDDFSFDSLISQEDNSEAVEDFETSETTDEAKTDEINAKYIQNMNDLMIKNNRQETLNNTNGNKKKISMNAGYSIENLISEKKLRMDISSLNSEDVDLFKKLANGAEVSLQNINTGDNLQPAIIVKDGTQVNYKSLDVSKGLSDMIEHAYKTQKPARLDFDGQSSVILKIDKQGKLSAEFVSGSAAMEQVLKTNIPLLKTKFETENIPYKYIGYKGGKKQNDKNNKNNN